MPATPEASIDWAGELAAFLRQHRQRLDPSDVGLPISKRARRTPGLRREEVAQLASVSSDYVVRLEQARGFRPSPEVLSALAHALRLDPADRAYLFQLGQPRSAEQDRRRAVADPMQLQLVLDLSPLPAMLLDQRFDIHAWNPEMAQVLGDFAALPPAHRNAMWICLLHPPVQAMYTDRAAVIRDGVAHLRAARAAHPNDRALASLIHECVTADAEIAAAWDAREFNTIGRGQKTLVHPRAGTLSLAFEVLIPLQDPDHRLLLMRPADEISRLAMRDLTTV